MIQIPKIAVKHNWRNARTKSGLYPIHISVYLSGEHPRYYPVKLPLNVSKQDWQGDYNHWTKDTHIFYFEINCKIAEVVTKFNEPIKRLYYNLLLNCKRTKIPIRKPSHIQVA